MLNILNSIFGLLLQGSGHASYVPNGRARGVNKGTTASSVPMNSDGTEGLEMPVPMNPDGTEGLEMLSSRLAAASPDQQKQMLGDRLFPLVNQLKVLLLYPCETFLRIKEGDLGQT